MMVGRWYRVINWRSCKAILAAVGVVVAFGTTLLGQTAGADDHAGSGSTDFRWGPWVGCWSTDHSESQTTPSREMCLVPVTGTAAADLKTIADGKVVDSVRINPDGDRHSMAREGCAGWERAEWNAEATRVYLQSEVTCQSRDTLRSTGLLGMSPSGDFIQVTGQTIGAQGRVAMTLDVPVDDSAALRLATTADTTAASVPSWARVPWGVQAPVGLADVRDASQHVDPGVVIAWLVELNPSFAVTARELSELQKARVPSSVIDVVVALSFPDRFVVTSAASRPVPNRPVTVLRQTSVGSTTARHTSIQWVNVAGHVVNELITIANEMDWLSHGSGSKGSKDKGSSAKGSSSGSGTSTGKTPDPPRTAAPKPPAG